MREGTYHYFEKKEWMGNMSNFYKEYCHKGERMKWKKGF